MSQPELPDCNTLAEESHKRHRRYMIRNSIAAAIFGVITIGLLCVLVTQEVSGSAFVLLIIGSALSGVYALGAMFEVGCEYTHGYYMPKIMQHQSEYHKLRVGYNKYIYNSTGSFNMICADYFDLIRLVKARSPELIDEFMAQANEQSQSPVEGNKN